MVADILSGSERSTRKTGDDSKVLKFLRDSRSGRSGSCAIDGQIVPSFRVWSPWNQPIVEWPPEPTTLTWSCIFTHFARRVMSRRHQASNIGMTIAVLFSILC